MLHLGRTHTSKCQRFEIFTCDGFLIASLPSPSAHPCSQTRPAPGTSLPAPCTTTQTKSPFLKDLQVRRVLCSAGVLCCLGAPD